MIRKPQKCVKTSKNRTLRKIFKKFCTRNEPYMGLARLSILFFSQNFHLKINFSRFFHNFEGFFRLILNLKSGKIAQFHFQNDQNQTDFHVKCWEKTSREMRQLW